jgi:hypothetical protein
MSRLRAGQAAVRFPAAKSVQASDNEAMAMTEQEWLACTISPRMFNAIWRQASNRKLRLVACARCRQWWKELVDDRSKKAVETAERFADYLADDQEREMALEQARLVLEEMVAEQRFEEAAVARIARVAAELAKHALADREEAFYIAGERVVHEDPIHCGVIREVFGNPFRPVTVDPAWRTSNVTAVAQAIYDDRAFDRLPILADALEDAGCDNADILNHCRQPGVHVRGCWVVDLMLGKE